MSPILVYSRSILFFMCLAVLCYKPLYFLRFLFLFCFEYLFFIKYIYDIYIYYNDYISIKIDLISMDRYSTLEIWIEYCRLNAFNRLYIILSREKTSKGRLFIALVFYFLGIPFRFLKISYFFIIENKESFRRGIIFLYYKLYFILKELRIEVLSGKIYLNCFTLGKLLRYTNLHKTETEKAFKLLMELKKISEDFANHESKLGYIEFNRMSIETKEGNKIWLHYGTGRRNTVHQTSFVPKILSESQIASNSFTSLIKEGSKNPGSIITIEPKIIKIDSKTKPVPYGEFCSAIYEYLDKFEIPEEKYQYIKEKVYRYEYVLQIYTKNVNPELVKQLRCDLYNHALLNSSEEDIINELDKWKYDIFE